MYDKISKNMYQPDDIMLLGAVPITMGDKDFHLLC